MLHSLCFLIRSSNSEMLSWPNNSPLLVMLQFVDPNIMSRDEHGPLQEGQVRETPLHQLALLADPFDYSTHVNQVILAKQLIEHGADVNGVSNPHSKSPLHSACYSGNVTNLDLVEYLLEEGADPNAQDYSGSTLLMYTIPNAPGAAKFLLNRPTTAFSVKVARPDNPEQVQDQFLIQQWTVIEEMLEERGAVDTNVTILE
jgi:ankyrin repeat protein